MPDQEGKNGNTWEELGSKIDVALDSTTDWTKEKWDETVESVTEAYKDTREMTKDEIENAKSYFKCRYDQRKHDSK